MLLLILCAMFLRRGVVAGRDPMCLPVDQPSASGGWGWSSSLPRELLERCDFQRVTANISAAEFERRFMRGAGEPVLLQLSVASRLFNLTRERFTARYGTIEVHAGHH